MKKLVLLFILFSTLFTTAQNGINYRALIKDGNGDVISNQAVTIQFIILEGGTTNVYQETHNPTADANGIVIANIGEGTVNSGDFSIINWDNDDYFLNVKVNTGSGLTDMGTTQFGAVPYALSVKDAPFKKAGTLISHPEQDDFLFGEATLDYQSGSEKKLFFDHSKGAFRAGIIENDLWDPSKLGTGSSAIGKSNEASGDYSVSLGNKNTASENRSVAIGTNSTSSGVGSVALGYFVDAESATSVAMGRYNIGGGTPTSIQPLDPLVEVGNGTSSTKSNALTILNNGTITAPSFDLAEITDAKALITKEYADINLESSGIDAIDEGNGIGYRLKGTNPANYGTIGKDATDLNVNSIASTTYGATGSKSFAQGSHTTSAGYASAAIGNFTTASGIISTAIGDYTVSSGVVSTAMGRNTKALANFSTSMGKNTIAEALSNTAIGQYNIGGGSLTSWVSTDPLFEIGNGTSTSNLSNALTVLKNGRVGIGKHSGLNGYLEIEGNSSLSTPQLSLVENNSGFARLKFSNSNRPGDGYWDIAGFIGEQGVDDRLNFFSSYEGNIMSLGGFGDVDINGWLEIKSDIGVVPLLNLKSEGIPTIFLRMQGSGRGGNDHWQFKAYISETGATADRLTFQNSDGGDIMYLTGGGNVFVDGSLAHASDRRLKRDIETIDFGIAEILKLNPVQYNWKDKENKPYKSLGVIAQEIEEIIPNVVQIGGDETQTLSVSYTELIPVLIKAIQEQQEIINLQQVEIGDLSEEISQIQQLTQRINQLEIN